MAKVITGVALIAGAVALNFIPGLGSGLSAMLMTHVAGLTAEGIVSSGSMLLGTMGAGMTLSAIAQALQGGGQALSSSIRSPLAPRVTIYGQTRVAGTVIYLSSIRYTMNQVVAWASHPCKSVDFIYLDGREVIFLGNGNKPVAGAQGFDQGGNFYDTAGNVYNFGGDGGGNYHVYCQSTLGSAAGLWFYLGQGLASPSGDGLVWDDPNWTSDCLMQGICATYIAAASEPNLFASIPGPKAAIHGKCDIYDPRLGAQYEMDGVTPNPATHIWTDNWALIIADFLTNAEFGVGCTWDEIDIDQLIVAANICDEQVPLAGVTNPWESHLNVSLGSQILDSNGNIETVIAVPTDGVGECGTTVPTWPTTVGGTVSDGNVRWRMSSAAPVTATWAANTAVHPGYQIVDSNGNIETADSPVTTGSFSGLAFPLPTAGWMANHAYKLGDKVLDSNGNIETVTAVTAGWNPASGATVPTWPTVPTHTVVDGAITWTMSAPEQTGSTAPTWPTVAGGTVTDGTVTWTMSPPNDTEKRYTINGSFDWSAAPGDILNEMLAAAEGRISYQGGVWKIFPAAWYGATLSFDLGDLTGPIKWTPRRKLRDLFNAVRATFVCPSYPYAVSGYDRNHKNGSIFDGQYQPTDAPEYAQDALHGYSSDLNLAQDAGIKLYADVRYKFVTSASTCQRLMKIRLLRNRQQGSGTLQMNLGAYQTCPQDIIKMTAAPLGWSDKYLEVSTFNFLLNAGKTGDGESGAQEEQAPTLGCQINVCETDPSVYAWSAAEERSLENISSPQALNSLQVADPTGLTIESDLTTALVGDDGVVTPLILANWTEPDDPFTTTGGSITIQYRLQGTSAWLTAGVVDGSITQFSIGGIVAGENYQVQIRAAHAGGAAGNWVSGGTVQASRLAPSSGSNTAALVTSFLGGGGTITFTWAAQTVAGISISAGSVTLSGLSGGAQYYSYWFINTSAGTINSAGAAMTYPSFSQMVQAASAGNLSLGCFSFKFPSGPPGAGATILLTAS